MIAILAMAVMIVQLKMLVVTMDGGIIIMVGTAFVMAIIGIGAEMIALFQTPVMDTGNGMVRVIVKMIGQATIVPKRGAKYIVVIMEYLLLIPVR